MSREPRAATIYTAQLAALFEGFPLWDPSPGSQPAVEIADIGYVQYGAWARLFNASKPLDDPSNDLGVPDEYQQLNVGKIQQRACLPARAPILSESMEHHALEIAVSGGVPVQGGGGFNFKCSKEQGAVLLLGDDGDRRDAFCKQNFARYIVEHNVSWINFANKIQKRGIMLDDLVLVTGCDKTSSWACAAFSKESSEAGIAFNVGQPGVTEAGISISWTWKNCSSVATRSGPPKSVATTIQRSVDPFSARNKNNLVDAEGDTHMADTPDLSPAALSSRNQCVFLRGYKICDRKTWSARRLLRRKKQYDGFELVKHKKRDDTDDPGSGSSKRSDFRSGQDAPRESPCSSSGSQGHGGSTTNNYSGSVSSGKSDDKSASSPDTSDGLELLDSDSLDSQSEDDLVLSQHKEPTLLDIVVDYILENSAAAELALVHDDDLAALFQHPMATPTICFERHLHNISPIIYVNDQVGMLETTHNVAILDSSDIQQAEKSDTPSTIAFQPSGPRSIKLETDVTLENGSTLPGFDLSLPPMLPSPLPSTYSFCNTPGSRPLSPPTSPTTTTSTALSCISDFSSLPYNNVTRTTSSAALSPATSFVLDPALDNSNPLFPPPIPHPMLPPIPRDELEVEYMYIRRRIHELESSNDLHRLQIAELELSENNSRRHTHPFASEMQTPFLPASIKHWSIPPDWAARTAARVKLFCTPNRAGNALCAWHGSRREHRIYPPRTAPPNVLDCGCTYVEALFEESLARNHVGTLHPGDGIRIDPALRNPLLKLLEETYGYRDGDFERRPNGEWLEGEEAQSWEQRASLGKRAPIEGLSKRIGVHPLDVAHPAGGGLKPQL